MADHPFKPNGTAPPFDLEEYRDTFSVWKMKWDVFIRLSNIDEVLEQARRAQYKADVLISCLSPTTLHTVMSMELTDEDLRNPTTIITKFEERCKAGRNEHVWRYQFHCNCLSNHSTIFSVSYATSVLSAVLATDAVKTVYPPDYWIKSLLVSTTTTYGPSSSRKQPV